MFHLPQASKTSSLQRSAELGCSADVGGRRHTSTYRLLTRCDDFCTLSHLETENSTISRPDLQQLFGRRHTHELQGDSAIEKSCQQRTRLELEKEMAKSGIQQKPKQTPRVRTIRGPKHHINIRISHSGSKAQYQKYCFCRFLMFMWSFWALTMSHVHVTDQLCVLWHFSLRKAMPYALGAQSDSSAGALAAASAGASAAASVERVCFDQVQKKELPLPRLIGSVLPCQALIRQQPWLWPSPAARKKGTQGEL